MIGRGLMMGFNSLGKGRASGEPDMAVRRRIWALTIEWQLGSEMHGRDGENV